MDHPAQGKPYRRKQMYISIGTGFYLTFAQRLLQAVARVEVRPLVEEDAAPVSA